MLTADLLRVKDDQKAILPRYIDLNNPRSRTAPKARERARDLIDLFQSHLHRTRGELEEAIADLVGDGTDYLVSRGLTKLLMDRTSFATATDLDPLLVREQVFQLATQHHPVVTHADKRHPLDRAAFLLLAAERLSSPERAVSPQDIEDALYADMEEHQRLTAFDPIDPEDLLRRYNLALAQAVLYRASALNVRLHNPEPQALRYLFRFIKFCRLMHTVRKTGREQWDIILDGPMSLFDSTQKYGLQMAVFLPALLTCEGWELEAELSWGPRRERRVFQLDDACGLHTHYNQKGVYVTEEQTFFEDRFNELGSPWILSRDAEVIDLGGKDACIPDLVFRHRDDGRTALLEIIGFWRKGWLEAKAEHLKKHGPSHLILAVSDRLRADKDGKGVDVDLGGVHLYPFKGVLLPKKLLELVEAVAV